MSEVDGNDTELLAAGSEAADYSEERILLDLKDIQAKEALMKKLDSTNTVRPNCLRGRKTCLPQLCSDLQL